MPGTMLGTDQIFMASSALADDPGLCVDAVGQLKAVAQSPAYKDWGSGLAQQHPFVLPHDLADGVLNRLGLVKNGALCVRVNSINRSVLVTDGVWVDPRVRVFPFADESSAIAKYCRDRQLDLWPTLVIDLATGSGHNLAHFGDEVHGVGMDINPRALGYFHFNRILNGTINRVVMLNDIRNGFSDIVRAEEASKPLILANMPFGLAPTRDMLAFTSDGGETGLQLQKAAFSAVARFRQTPQGAGARAVMLGYSIGNAAEDRWEMVDLARSTFGAETTTVVILDDEGLVRVDGRRMMPNPSPLGSALHLAGSCRLYHKDTETAQALYSELSNRLAAQGTGDLAYMIIEIGPDR
jgi:hypothetical protein